VILKQSGLEGFFDAISDGNNITNSKPDPEVFIKGALFLGLDCGECYVVEDAKAGVDAGKAGGFTTIALGDAYGYKKSDYSVKDFCEILTIA
jgi:HAD superfamily hydrolase (TIGR01509 family)